MNAPRPMPFDENRPPFVTVLIVAFNGKKYLGACLDSVLDQDFPREHYDVMVIDNSSRDGSADFVERNYPMVKVVRMEQNYGPNRALTVVGDLLHTKYVAYLNQDVVVHRRWLVELWEVIKSHPQAGVVESNMILPRWPEYKGLKRDGLIERAYPCDVSAWGTHEFRIMPVTPTTPPVPVLSVYGAGTLSNLAILGKLDHVLDSDFFAYADDLDLGLRLNATGFQVLLAPRSVVYHDTDWHFKWDMRSIRRSLWVTRNTILAFYKSSYWDEFLVILPRLLLGKLIKAGQHQKHLPGKLFYGATGVPLLLVGLIQAIANMPRFAERRRRSLAQRKMPHGWLTHRLIDQGWKADPAVWTQLPDGA